jgi:hypothetical protein
MHKLSYVCLAAALVAGSALAAPAAPTEVQATSQQLHDVEGSYRLSNGRVLKLIMQDDRLYAELKNHRTELVAVGENAFASRDGSISVTYKPDAATEQISVSFGVDPLRALPDRATRSLWASR